VRVAKVIAEIAQKSCAGKFIVSGE